MTPVGHAVSLDVCVLLPLSSFWHPRGNTSDKLLSNGHVAPLKFVSKMVSDVLLLPYFLGVAWP